MASRLTRLKSEKFQNDISSKRGRVVTTETAEVSNSQTKLSEFALDKMRSLLLTLFLILSTQKKESGYTVSPYLLGFIFFVLVGSSVFELLKNVGGKK